VAVSVRNIKVMNPEVITAVFAAYKLNSDDKFSGIDFVEAVADDIPSSAEWKQDETETVIVSLGKMVRYMYQFWYERYGLCHAITIELRRFHETYSVRV
jgi:hypothetical protein